MKTDKKDESPLGLRIAILRSRRGISRRVLANLVGRSEEWLRLIETGRRPLDSLNIILQMAEILHVTDISALIGTRPEVDRDRPRRDGRLSRLRSTVTEVPWLRHTETPAPVASVTMEEVWERWRTSPTRYSDVAAALPPRLAYFQDMTEAEPSRQEWRSALISCYSLARSVFNRTGDHDVAYTAADRAMGLAASSASPWALPVAAWHLAATLLHLGRPRSALECVTAALRRLDERHPRDEDWTWLTGATHLLAAEIAAARYDTAAARGSLASAHEIAERMTADRLDLGVCCGPTEYGIVRVRVALQLGDTEQALRYAKTLHIPPSHSAVRANRHYITLGQAYASRHNDVAAVYALTKVEQTCREDIYYDATAHRTLRFLAERNDLTAKSDLERLLALVPLENLPG